jgi:hypothetical protein
MNVKGHVIPEELLDRASRYFPIGRSFTFGDMCGVLLRMGVPYEVSDRAADRLLQRMRKARTHVFSGGKWHSLNP